MPSSESQKRASKAYRDRKYKLGLCTICGKETEGTHYCPVHQEYYRKMSNHKRQLRKGSNRCTRCGSPLNPDADAGCSCCINCREEFNFL